MKRRRKGQGGPVVARCGVDLLLLGNEEGEAQEQHEEEQQDELE